MTIICRVFDALYLHVPCGLLWHVLTRVTVLSQNEIEAGESVLWLSAVRYEDVRIAEGRLLSIIFRLNGGRAFTLFHTINLPVAGNQSRPHLDIIIHELVHVCQFELIGSVYIWQALKAQREEGYAYGGWQQLAIDREHGGHFFDYNREQQGQIAQDYYNLVIAGSLPADDPVSMAFQPFIEELRNGEL